MDLVPCQTPLMHCQCKGLFGSCNHKSHHEAASSLFAHTCRGNVPRGRIRHALGTVGNTATAEAAWDGLPSFKVISSFFDLQSSWESRGCEDGTSFLEADPGDPHTGSCWRPQLCAASACKSLTRAGLGLRYRCWIMSQNRLSYTCKRCGGAMGSCRTCPKGLICMCHCPTNDRWFQCCWFSILIKQNRVTRDSSFF